MTPGTVSAPRVPAHTWQSQENLKFRIRRLSTAARENSERQNWRGTSVVYPCYSTAPAVAISHAPKKQGRRGPLSITDMRMKGSTSRSVRVVCHGHGPQAPESRPTEGGRGVPAPTVNTRWW